jgi:hypothetical protein
MSRSLGLDLLAEHFLRELAMRAIREIAKASRQRQSLEVGCSS